MNPGKKVGAWWWAETSSGSDAAAMKTRATRVGDNYTINGSKMFITNGSAAQVYVVMAVTDAGANRSGVSAFIVDRATAGFGNGRKNEKHRPPSPDTAERLFAHLRVAAAHMSCRLRMGYRPKPDSP